MGAPKHGEPGWREYWTAKVQEICAPMIAKRRAATLAQGEILLACGYTPEELVVVHDALWDEVVPKSFFHVEET